MSPTPSNRALPLIEMIYRAAVVPDVWNEVLEALSFELDSPVIGMNLEVPGVPSAQRVYRVNSAERFGRVFASYAMRGELPWDLGKVSSTRFQLASEVTPDVDIESTDFYHEYMEPQGLGVPLGVNMGRVKGVPVAAVGIYPRTGSRELSADDRSMLDLLAPHLAQAYRIHRRLRSQEQHREAVAEVMDRMPTGVIFVDSDGRLVGSNRAAQRILALEDGLELRDGRPHATIAAKRGLRRLVEDAVHMPQVVAAGDEAIHVLRLSRPSGRRAFTALVERLQAAPVIGYARDAVAVVFLSDPDVRQEGAGRRIASLYGLTMAEAELTGLLCDGKTLDEAAAHRGVTSHTARSQLKRVFVKTGTSRQVDLVRLVLTGVASLRDLEASAEEGEPGA